MTKKTEELVSEFIATAWDVQGQGQSRITLPENCHVAMRFVKSDSEAEIFPLVFPFPFSPPDGPLQGQPRNSVVNAVEGIRQALVEEKECTAGLRELVNSHYRITFCELGRVNDNKRDEDNEWFPCVLFVNPAHPTVEVADGNYPELRIRLERGNEKTQ